MGIRKGIVVSFLPCSVAFYQLVLRLVSCFLSVCVCSSANITCAKLRHYVTMPV